MSDIRLLCGLRMRAAAFAKQCSAVCPPFSRGRLRKTTRRPFANRILDNSKETRDTDRGSSDCSDSTKKMHKQAAPIDRPLPPGEGRGEGLLPTSDRRLLNTSQRLVSRCVHLPLTSLAYEPGDVQYNGEPSERPESAGAHFAMAMEGPYDGPRCATRNGHTSSATCCRRSTDESLPAAGT
jgi:hypothetical protein